MNERVYLNVPFSQKEHVKKLGAHYDFNKKSWYVESHVNTKVFTQWLPPIEPNVKLISNPQFKNSSGDGFQSTEIADSLTLSGLLQMVEQSVRINFPQALWVRAEIAQVKQHNGHYYFELIQREEHTGQELAKVRATLWNSNTHIIKQFEQETGRKIVADLNFLIKVRCVFHRRFSFSLEIVQINVAYTLGEMQKKINAIRKKLKDQGIYQLNKHQIVPKPLARFAVISPQSGAGLADFRHYIDPLVAKGVCHCDYYHAIFQGALAQQSLAQRLQEVLTLTKHKNYQLVAIIRGGGSITDLQFLEEYEITRLICESPVPIWVGLGHETDKLLINEISHRQFPTPTAVAQEIVHHLVKSLQTALNQWNQINLLVKQVISQRHNEIDKYYFLLNKNYYHLIRRKNEKLDKIKTILNFQIQQKIRTSEQNLEQRFLKIKYLSHLKCTSACQSLQQLAQNLDQRSRQQIFSYKNKIQTAHTIIKHSDPHNILKRGFAIVRDDTDKPVKRLSELKDKQMISIQIDKEKINAQVRGKLKNQR